MLYLPVLLLKKNKVLESLNNSLFVNAQHFKKINYLVYIKDVENKRKWKSYTLHCQILVAYLDASSFSEYHIFVICKVCWSSIFGANVLLAMSKKNHFDDEWLYG